MQIKISIITVVRNNIEGIAKTIESVLEQDYQLIEYIIIDGMSTDGTLEIINSYKQGITKIISEKDSNLYDAINKGIKISSGSYIGLLHSGDKYIHKQVISNLVNEFKNADLIISNMLIINNLKINICKPQFNYLHINLRLNHPTWFVKKEVFLANGLYDIKYKIAADYDYALRIFNKINYRYINIESIYFSLGGVSYNNLNVLMDSFLVRSKNKKMLLLNIFIFFYEVSFLIIYRIFKKIKHALYY